MGVLARQRKSGFGHKACEARLFTPIIQRNREKHSPIRKKNLKRGKKKVRVAFMARFW